jgi:hypothetical protein
MMGQGEIDETSRGRFMQAVQTELDNFERKETEFLKNDRKERAAKLAVLTEANRDVFHH